MMNSEARSFTNFSRTLMAGLVAATAFMAASPAANAAAPAVSLDVPYVPTPREVVNRMLEVAKVGSQDFVIDLGSGDGRIAIAAVKDHGAKGAMGVDLNPERIAEATANANEAGVADKVEFREQNLFDTDFSNASVLTMYLLPDVNISLRPKILDLAPGTRVVSHAFDMDEWEPDHFERVDGRSVYLWIVPAKVEGGWSLEGPDGTLQLQLAQEFQNVSGTATASSGKAQPVMGKLNGHTIEFSVGEGDSAVRYSGNVQGNTMLVTAGGANGQGAGQTWKGSRQ